MKQILIGLVGMALINILSCSSCKNAAAPVPDNPYGLPNATQTGANTFACRINGKNYIVSNWNIGSGTLLNGDTLLGCRAPFGSQSFTYLTLSLKNKFSPELYSLDNINYSIQYLTDSTCLGILSTVLNANSIIGQIEVTRLDKVNRVFSGKFNCKIPLKGCDTLNITDGRFDTYIYFQ